MSEPKRKDLLDKFVKNLANLDSGERARFKRNAGRLPQDSNRVLGLFYNKVLPHGVGPWAEDWYFLVATLYPLEKETASEIPIGGNLGGSLRQVRTEKNGNGLDRRVERLLDADEYQLPFQLRQAVHFLTSNQGRINWRQLTRDLLYWSDADHRVQKRWAKDYFVPHKSTETN